MDWWILDCAEYPLGHPLVHVGSCLGRHDAGHHGATMTLTRPVRIRYSAGPWQGGQSACLTPGSCFWRPPLFIRMGASGPQIRGALKTKCIMPIMETARQLLAQLTSHHRSARESRVRASRSEAQVPGHVLLLQVATEQPEPFSGNPWRLCHRKESTAAGWILCHETFSRTSGCLFSTFGLPFNRTLALSTSVRRVPQ